MILTMSILRFLHIVAGIIWAGGGILMNLMIGPAIAATGDAGKQFASHLMGKTAFTRVMMSSAIITVLAGTILYGIDSNWFRSGWMMSGQGIGFGIGGVAGILAMVFGAQVGQVNGALGALGAQIQGKPTAEQMGTMDALRKRQAFIVPANTICILVAIIFMATARFMG